MTTPPTPSPRLRYEPALDGLRGFAVLAVIGYHAQVGWLRGGLVGVDVFFVLSGYLITALLIAERSKTGRIGLAAFYARRARRLLPALFLLLIGIAAFSAFIAYSGDRGAIRADALCSLFYVQNWHLIWSGRSYFTDFAAPSPARHLWSLAIEEQFYIVWPVVLILLLRVAKRRRWVLVTVMTALMAGSVVLMAATYSSGSDPSRAYYGTDTRAHEFLVGALLAVFLSRPRRVLERIRPFLPAAAVLASAVLVAVVTRVSALSEWLFRGGFYRGGVFGIAIVTAVIVLAVTCAPTSVVHRLLSSSWLRATGRISYGLYLWHWPVLLWLTPHRTGLHGVWLLAPRVAVTFAIAIASYVFIEQPARTAVSPTWRGRRLKVLAAAALAVVVLAASVTRPTAAPELIDTALPGYSAPARPGPTAPSTTPHDRAVLQYLAVHDASAWKPGDLHLEADGHVLADGVVFLPKLDERDGRPHVVMVGDSVLFTLARGFAPGPTSHADYYSYSQPGCGFLPGTDVDRGRVGSHLPSCPLLPTRWKMLVDRRQPDLSFLFVGAFEVSDRLINGHIFRVGTTGWATRLRNALTRDVDLFSSRGGLVALPTVPCFDPPDYGVAGVAGGATDRNDPGRVAAVNAVVRQVARARPKVVRIVDLASLLCPNGHATEHINGVTMRQDGVHFTRGGARIVSRWLAPRLEALIPPGPVLATAR